MRAFLAVIALASALEAGARFALGDAPFGVLFLAIAIALGVVAARYR